MADLSIEITDKGIWKIDGVQGKQLVLLNLSEDGVTLTNCPKHDEILEILEAILHAELENDLFTFEDGVYGKNSRRPPQFFKKANRIQVLLDEYSSKAQEAGIDPVKKNKPEEIKLADLY